MQHATCRDHFLQARIGRVQRARNDAVFFAFAFLTQIDERDLSVTAVTAAKESPDLTLMEAMERNAILQMLKDTNGNKLETAKRLGIGRQTLYNKIKAYGIET